MTQGAVTTTAPGKQSRARVWRLVGRGVVSLAGLGSVVATIALGLGFTSRSEAYRLGVLAACLLGLSWFVWVFTGGF